MLDAHDTAVPEEGTILRGRYRLGRMVGCGTRTVVCEVRDLQGERDLAVKMLRTEHARSPLAAAHLEREILIQARLSWPALTVYDRGVSEGRPYYITDLAPGVTLAEILIMRGGRRLGLEPALWIAADVARAIHNAHAFGVVHGNICPPKVLVSRRDLLDHERARLLDFSRSRVVDVNRFERHPEEIDPSWWLDTDPPPESSVLRLVPEDLSGRKRNYQSDFFGLGALMFEMIAGPLPTMEAVVGGWKPHEALGPAVPVEMKNLIAEALERCPEARCRSAYDVFLKIMQVIARIHPPDREFPAEPGPGASDFHYSAQRPARIDWRLLQATA
jgi:serine/threonine-protein kinase